MRRKIKELMNKEEGFTLVELLAVIVILGIIVAIAIPAIGNVINKADEGAKKAEEGLVLDAARLYVTVGGGDARFGEVAAAPPLTLKVKEDLIERGYLEEEVKPGTENGTVVVTRTEGTGGTEESPVYKYAYVFTPAP